MSHTDTSDLIALVIKTLIIMQMILLKDLHADVQTKPITKHSVKHRKAPQVNMGVNYIAKHNASIDEDFGMTHHYTTTIHNSEKKSPTSYTTTSSTAKLSNNSTIHNFSTNATKSTAIQIPKSTTTKTLNSTKDPHTFGKNVTQMKSTHQTKNTLYFENSDVSSTTQETPNIETQIDGKDYAFTSLFYCSFIYCKDKDSERLCPDNCRADSNAVAVQNINMNRTTSFKFPKRNRVPKNRIHQGDSFKNYLLVQDWDSIKQYY